MTDWISIYDEMPKLYEAVLCFTIDKDDIGDMDFGHCWEYRERPRKSKWAFDSISPIDNEKEEIQVTHWMPLPAPPEHFPDAGKKVKPNAI